MPRLAEEPHHWPLGIQVVQCQGMLCVLKRHLKDWEQYGQYQSTRDRPTSKRPHVTNATQCTHLYATYGRRPVQNSEQDRTEPPMQGISLTQQHCQ